MGLTCVLSLWNTGGSGWSSRSGGSKLGHSLCFREWQQPAFRVGILNEFDQNGINKFLTWGFVL